MVRIDPSRTEWGKVSPHKMRRWGTSPKIRRKFGSLFSRIWGRVGLEAVLFETLSSYITHYTSNTGKRKTLREPREQRVISPASPTICELNKFNINSHLPRVHPMMCRDSWSLGQRRKGRVWPLMNVDETPREGRASQVCRRTSRFQHQAASTPACQSNPLLANPASRIPQPSLPDISRLGLLRGSHWSWPRWSDQVSAWIPNELALSHFCYLCAGNRIKYTLPGSTSQWIKERLFDRIVLA